MINNNDSSAKTSMLRKIIRIIKMNNYNFKFDPVNKTYSFYEIDIELFDDYVSEGKYIDDFYIELTEKELFKYYYEHYD